MKGLDIRCPRPVAAKLKAAGWQSGGGWWWRAGPMFSAETAPRVRWWQAVT